MAKNENLHKAKDAKKDEFYTQYDDIQSEINHFEDKFKGKAVLCNCDDPFESNFCKFFLRNFNYLGLKRLICTSYGTSPVVGQQLTLFDFMDEPVVRGSGYVMDITEVPMANGRGVSDEDIDSLLKSKKCGVKKLKGDGDFRSEECVEYLKQADVVVTNPPFSLFREYVAQLMEYQKDFLIIGSKNAITYKEIFPLIKEDKIWLGPSFTRGNAYFRVPNGEQRTWADGVYDTNSGLVKFRNVGWFTNLDYAIRHEELVLYKRYYGNEDEYPHYANYDAINVDKVADIPCDYFEEIGVPITYLDKHNPEQFEVIGASRWLGKPMSEIAPKGSYVAGGVRFYLPVDCSQFVNVERERERERESERERERESRSAAAALPLPLRQNCHQAHDTDGCMTGSLSGVKYSGIMGVPITFLEKYSPEQFEIVGCADYTGKYGSDEIGINRIGEEWIAKYRAQGGRGHYTANMTSLVYYDTSGNAKNTFKRILIRRRISQ
ncbi:MAG: adenine-specific methyltransferase EcoRI family protein [Christensenellaceae bacterium]